MEIKKSTWIMIFILAVSAVVLASLFIIFFQSKKAGPESLAVPENLYQMIAGKLTEISHDQNYFIVDIDALGKHDPYKVYVNSETKFSLLTYPSASENKNLEEMPEPEKKNGQFSDLKKDMEAKVYFANFTDIHAEKLMAQSVEAIESPELPSEEVNPVQDK
jgi:hypothetical protein